MIDASVRPEIPHLRRRLPRSLLDVVDYDCVARSLAPCIWGISERTLEIGVSGHASFSGQKSGGMLRNFPILLGLSDLLSGLRNF